METKTELKEQRRHDLIQINDNVSLCLVWQLCANTLAISTLWGDNVSMLNLQSKKESPIGFNFWMKSLNAKMSCFELFIKEWFIEIPWMSPSDITSLLHIVCVFRKRMTVNVSKVFKESNCTLNAGNVTKVRCHMRVMLLLTWGFSFSTRLNYNLQPW